MFALAQRRITRGGQQQQTRIRAMPRSHVVNTGSAGTMRFGNLPKGPAMRLHSTNANNMRSSNLIQTPNRGQLGLARAPTSVHKPTSHPAALRAMSFLHNQPAATRNLTRESNRRFCSSTNSAAHDQTRDEESPFDASRQQFQEKMGGLYDKGRLNPSIRGSGALYLDMQSTTPIDPRVVDQMMPFMIDMYGNPASRTHSYGWEADAFVEKSRKEVAEVIGAQAKDIVFTSGATESNNIAIKGTSRFYKAKKNHIVTLQTEHKCVLDSCRALEGEGFNVTYLPVQKNGLVDLQQLEEAIRPETTMVSVMAVNNEIGVIQPLAEIGKLCRRKKTFFHTDAAQAFGKIPIHVDEMNIDLLSVSGHKVYGPKGIGALYVRRRPRVRIEALQSGGGHERGIRSGTLPSQLIVGLGAAASIAKQEMARDERHVSDLFERLWGGIRDTIPEVYLNGDEKHRYKGCLNVSFAGVEGESLMMALPDIACSSGSACTSASLEPSYVLRALGVAEEMAHTSLRIGIGRFTTRQEVEETLHQLQQHVSSLREMSPLWEMMQEGIDLSTIEWKQHGQL